MRGAEKSSVKNLVKRGKEAFLSQVVENAAKINMETMSQLTIAKCYSEYIESRKKEIQEGAL
jgi:hypothetical protein